jgi:hypothetical protein
MATNAGSVERRARRLFFVGWFLAVFNLLAILWAIWLPIDLMLRQKQASFLWMDYTFFFVDEQTAYAFWASMSIAALFLFMLFQALYLPRLAGSLSVDDPATDAAEAALAIARFLAVAALFFCFLSFLFDVQRYSTWRTLLEFQQ